MTDRIQQQITIAAPVLRVWQALTDSRQFGEWFLVRMDGLFQPGQVARGQITHPGYEHLTMELTVQEMVPERRFSFTWHPFAVEPEVDYTHETPTLVVFELEAVAGGTRLTVTESGFDALPAERRDRAFRANEGGWKQQMGNIAAYASQPR